MTGIFVGVSFINARRIGDGGEAVAAPGDGLDVLLRRLAALVAACERFAQSEDVLRERRLLDEGVGPDFLEQLPLRHHAPAAPHQDEERVELLRRQPDVLRAAPERALRGVQDERAELVEAVGGARHKGF